MYDPGRSSGLYWPPKNDPVLYRAVLPRELRRLGTPHGVAGAIVVEASPRASDNRWVLEVAARDDFLLGLVGYLRPGTLWFARQLKSLAADPLFRGVRVGTWGNRPRFDSRRVLRDLQRLAERDLALDILAEPQDLREVARVASAVPQLRIVIEHCAGVGIDGEIPPREWTQGLRICSERPNVFMKVSGLVEGTGRLEGTAPTNGSYYRPVLDAVWKAFGEDRLIFASDWPVCSRFASYATVFNIVDGYVRAHGSGAAEKVFSLNAERIYRLASA